MASPTIAVTVLAYRTEKTIREAIRSAVAQTYGGPINVRIREQAGNDAECRLLQHLTEKIKEIPNRTVHAERGENLGFASGHNKLIRDAIREDDPQYVLCLNADAVLMPDFVEKALPAFDDPAVGAVQGKLLRWDTERNDVRRGPNGKPIIDTTGLLPLRNRRIINRGQGEEDVGKYDERTEAWGPDGAAPLYRRAALEDVAVPTKKMEDGRWKMEFFDEDFFAYKEDVDLAWRLRWREWKTVYVPEAVAWHGRGSGESAARKPLAILRERRKIPPLAKYYSFSNQRLMQIKNETLGGLARDIVPFVVKECGAWGVALLMERKTIPAAWRTLRLAPSALRKRRWIMKHRRVGADPCRFFK